MSNRQQHPPKDVNDPRQFSLRVLITVTAYGCVTLGLMVNVGFVAAGLSMIAVGAFTAGAGYYRRHDGLIGFGHILTILGLATISVTAVVGARP